MGAVFDDRFQRWAKQKYQSHKHKNYSTSVSTAALFFSSTNIEIRMNGFQILTKILKFRIKKMLFRTKTFFLSVCREATQRQLWRKRPSVACSSTSTSYKNVLFKRQIFKIKTEYSGGCGSGSVSGEGRWRLRRRNDCSWGRSRSLCF